MKKLLNSLKKVLSPLKNIFLLVTIIFIVWMLFFDANSWLIHKELNNEIDALNTKKEFYEREIKSDEKEINYEKSIPGVEVRDYISMKKNINHIINNYDTYINKYNNKSRTILSKYYDISKTESCSKFRDLIDKNL